VSNSPGGAEVLIAGGGIGGLTAALALARAGSPVRVLERASEFVEIGAGIQLAPNATRILAELDVLDEVLSVGVVPNRLVLSSALTGDELTSLDLKDFPERYGAPYVVLHRSDLLAILLAACQANDQIALETESDVVRGDSEDAEVVAVLADGSTRRGAALIGADGLRSTIRAQIVEDEPVESGYVAYRGALPLGEIVRPSDLGDVVVFIGPGLHFVQYPVRRGELYNQVAVFRSARYLRGEEPWGDPSELTEAFRGVCDHVQDGLRSIKRDKWWQMTDRRPIDRWTQGRMALLGDAAHPMLQYLAQGACQAIEDAAALGLAARRWVRDDTAVEEALEQYAASRIPQASLVQTTARQWGDLWHLDGMGAAVRNAYLRERAIDDHRHVEWLYGPTSSGGPS